MGLDETNQGHRSAASDADVLSSDRPFGDELHIDPIDCGLYYKTIAHISIKLG